MFVCSESDTADVSEDHEPVYIEYPIGPGCQFSRAEETHSCIEELHKITEEKFVASETKLTDLFKGRCQEPGSASKCQVKSKSVGCSVEILWNCQNGHKC